MSGGGDDPKVVPSAVLVEPGELELIPRQRAVLVGMARDAEGKDLPSVPVRWRSLDPGVASVGGDGTVLGISSGETVVEAEAGGKVAEVSVRVRQAELSSLEIEPKGARVVEGEELQLAARVLDEGGRSHLGLPIHWESSDRKIVRISEDGRVLAVRAGASATITATLEGLVGTATIEVIPPVTWVEVLPSQEKMLEGATLVFSAIAKDTLFRPQEGRTTEWRSLSPTIASVDEKGLVTAHRTGETEIRAFVEGKMGWSALEVLPRATSLEVTTTLPRIRVGGQVDLIVVARDARGEPVKGLPLIWTSSRPEVAQVLGGKIVQGMGVGEAILRARNEEHGVEGEARITVGPKGRLVIEGIEMEVLEPGRTYQLGVSFVEDDGSVVAPVQPIWTSRDEAVATVDESGRVEVKGLGRATITVQAEGSTVSLDKNAALRFVDLALGEEATCGLSRHGSVWCWGKKWVPMRSAYVGAARWIPEEAASGMVAIRHDPHRCLFYPQLTNDACGAMIGLTEEGDVVAWSFGLPPQKLSFPEPFFDVSADGEVCGVTAGGDVLCENGGALGTTSAQRVHAARGGFCLLDDAGRVSCEESGGTRPDLSAYVFSPLGKAGTIFPISLSPAHGCGLTTGGAAVCWGENGRGQVQRPPQSEVRQDPAIVASDVRSLAVDEDASFFVGMDGLLEVRGGKRVQVLEEINKRCPANVSYERDEQSTVDIDAKVESFDRQGEIASVHAGSGDHRCVLLENGAAYCWGVTTMGKAGMQPISCPFIAGPVLLPTALFPER